MDVNIKQKWLEALRSGKYKQGSKCLRPKEDEFCCLGVLCDVINNEGWKECAGDELYSYTGPHAYESNTLIPSDLSYELDLTTQAQTKLAKMNDSGESFEVIAQYIEENL
jgi:hypothetical protein